MISKAELTSKVKDWRFTDLGRIERLMEDVYSSVQKIGDSDSVGVFLDELVSLRNEQEKLFKEMDSMSKKVKEMKSEMEKQENK